MRVVILDLTDEKRVELVAEIDKVLQECSQVRMDIERETYNDSPDPEGFERWVCTDRVFIRMQLKLKGIQ
jgi:hypothetical protein